MVVANGSESEPASRKDAVLLTHTPHLVIDGAMVAATAVGADEVVLYVKRSDPRVWAAVLRARRRAPRGRRARADPAARRGAEQLRQRPGDRGDRRTSTAGRRCRRPSRRGRSSAASSNRPTLVSNVETLAHMALIARHGADWFRSVGIADAARERARDAGRRRRAPGRLRDRLRQPRWPTCSRAAGGVSERPQALLVGGYGGAWLDAQHMQDLTLSEGDPLLAAGSIGAGVLWVLGERLVRRLGVGARPATTSPTQSAGQCGPCLHGLRAIADSFDLLAPRHARARTSARG